MKKLLFFLLPLAFAGAVNAQSDKYTAAMEKNLAMFDSAKSTPDFQAVAASFDRIGDAEKTQWLPYYYEALSLTFPAWFDTKIDKDANADRVKALCDKAESLTKENSDKAEILAIRNMVATQQMLVDPQTRYATYGTEGTKYLNQGMQLDPANPRLYYLQGAGIFGTPEQFGGGKAKAKPVLQKAVDLYKASQPKPLYPHWGQKETADMLAQCG